MLRPRKDPALDSDQTRGRQRNLAAPRMLYRTKGPHKGIAVMSVARETPEPDQQQQPEAGQRPEGAEQAEAPQAEQRPERKPWPPGRRAQTPAEEAEEEEEDRRPRPGAVPPLVPEVFDRAWRAIQAHMTMGVSPAAITRAHMDWWGYLADAPGRQVNLANRAWWEAVRLAFYAGQSQNDPNAPPLVEPPPHDKRFSAPEWRQWPFNVMAQGFLLAQNWWDDATSHLRGVTAQHEREINFLMRQRLDRIAPSNFPWTNPEVIRKTVETGGANFQHGMENLAEDVRRQVMGEMPVGTENFQVGRDVAITPGRVVYRNDLIELIQYSPQTDQVYPNPILIVPAWIMKYYILDLSPDNSLVRYLVEQGHTVFCISWKNPTENDRNLTMDDYRRLGIMAALDAVTAIVPDRKVDSVGYCIGGTLLMIAAATMARDHDDRLNSITLFASQVDFSDAGELMLFIDETELAYLEDMMWARGYLSPAQMTGAFQLLRSSDLIWSRIIKQYMMGERETMIDLMAWNADTTRMPYRMHSEYLRTLFLENRLSRGRYAVNGQPIALTDIKKPIFSVATLKDHIAPWYSVYKVKLVTDTDVTFCLTSGGHNAGVISEPGHPRRYHYIQTLCEGDRYIPPDHWVAQAPRVKGSWWPNWSDWLADRATGDMVEPPPTGAPERGYPALEDAPGIYVHQR